MGVATIKNIDLRHKDVLKGGMTEKIKKYIFLIY